MARGKVGTILIKLLSTAGTGFFYVKARAAPRQRRQRWRARARCARAAPANPRAGAAVAALLCADTQPRRLQKKNPKKLTHKLEFMKYDPRVMKHVLFTETKLK